MGKVVRVAWNDPTSKQGIKAAEESDRKKAQRLILGWGRPPRSQWQSADPPGMTPGQVITRKMKKNGKARPPRKETTNPAQYS